MADSNFVCRCIVGVLDKALATTNGNQFKLLFFLSRKVGSAGGAVSFSELERATSIGRNALRRALQGLVALGLVAVQAFAPTQGQPAVFSVPAIVEVARQQPQEPAPEPPRAVEAAKPPVIPHLQEYSAVWDVLAPLGKTIREPLSDAIVRSAMKIGRDWNRNGFQVGAMIYKRTKWFEVKLFGPRKWIYILNALRMGFESEARAAAEEQRHAKAEKQRASKRVLDFQEQRLPLVAAAPDEFSAEIERTAAMKRLPGTAAAS